MSKHRWNKPNPHFPDIKLSTGRYSYWRSDSPEDMRKYHRTVFPHKCYTATRTTNGNLPIAPYWDNNYY